MLILRFLYKFQTLERIDLHSLQGQAKDIIVTHNSLVRRDKTITVHSLI